MKVVFLIIIASVNPSEKDALNYYLQEMNVLYQEVGAKPTGRYKISETLMGSESTNLVSVMEFPSREALDKVFKSKKYKELVSYRQKAFLKLDALISEE
jgi:uncharacterized protein (DUF1330 family)